MKLPLLSVFAAWALFPATNRAAVPTQSETFSGTYTLTAVTEYDGVAVYGSTNSGNFSSLTLPVFASATIGSTTLGPTTVQVPVGATNLRVAICSVYGGATSATVGFTLDSTFAASVLASGGEAFSTAFPGQTEATIATDIEGAAGGNSTASTGLETFFNAFSADFPAVGSNNSAQGTMVNFSNATLGGSAALNVAPAPEPGTNLCLLMAGGALGLLGWRRHRTAQ